MEFKMRMPCEFKMILKCMFASQKEKIFKIVIRSADSNYPLLEKSDHEQKVSNCKATV